MTGYDILKKAVMRLGYEEYKQSSISLRGLEFLSQICVDLKLNAPQNLSQEISANAEVIETVCCGVAMLLSLTENDGDKNKIYTSLYNAKRTNLLSKIEYIEDVLPITKGGVG